jgi:hypothetical protein
VSPESELAEASGMLDLAYNGVPNGFSSFVHLSGFQRSDLPPHQFQYGEAVRYPAP